MSLSHASFRSGGFAIAALLLLTAMPLAGADAPDAAADFNATDAPNHEKAAAPLHISHGGKFALTDFLVPGKTTIFDFYSEYCPPCRAIGPHVDKLHTDRSDIAVVKVDINRAGHRGIDWTSPVVQEYKLESIPHFAIFSPEGKPIAEGDVAYEKVQAMVQANEK